MLFHRDFQRPFWRGFLHAVTMTLYILFIALLTYSIPHLFMSGVGIVIEWAFYLFIVILTLAVAAYLIFYEPMRHIVHHHFKRATVMIVSTIGWLFVFLIIFILGLLWTVTPF